MSVTSIYKKGSRQDCSNYRGISVLGAFQKVLGRIIKSRLEAAVEGKINETQNGFVKGRGCTDGVFVLRQLTDKCLRKNKNLH